MNKSTKSNKASDSLNIILSSLNNLPFVIPFESGSDKFYPFDFTESNTELSTDLISDTNRFSSYIEAKLRDSKCRYGLGGYNEDRILYARSTHFDAEDEPRRLHLGVDIWGPAGTPVFAPIEGTVHSFQFNNHFGDYGATIILKHEIQGIQFHTLYGHLDLQSINNLKVGEQVLQGQQIARFGIPAENGDWPPHLHFQIINDIEGKKGDYPGVCRSSEKKYYLINCPDPELILRANPFILHS